MESIVFDAHMPASQILSSASVSIHLPEAPSRFYWHGWQSWSLTAWTKATQQLPVQAPRILHPTQIDPAYGQHPRPHGSWVSAVTFDDEVLLLGSLGLDAHVELSGRELHGWYEIGKEEWFIAHGDEATVFSRYADELSSRFDRKSDKPAPRVWCSWYSLYSAIDESILLRVLNDLCDLPFDVFQVDDGWQIAIGDWEANSKFPSGMRALANRIKSTGRKAGLWLAPLIAVKSSKLFREHPDWFLRDESGNYVPAGFNWGEQLYALDTTRQEVLDWLTALMKQVREWKYDYIKLDFLYGGALPGNRHLDMPREAAYRLGLGTIREALGDDAYVLACGAPILPSLGLCDALRIGPDVASHWEDHRDAILLYNPAIPGTRNAIRTTLNRLWLQPLVQVDPDMAYFRSVECSLAAEQKSLLQSLALICGFKATSDLPQWLTPDEKNNLRIFLQTKPQVRQISSYCFEIDGRDVNFSAAVPLPESATGFEAVQGAIVGRLADYGWVLRIMHILQLRAYEKRKRSIKD